MTRSEQINELATALAKAQGAIKGAVKDSENPFYHSKYADLSAVWDACREPLSGNGLSVVQTLEGNGVDGPICVETTLLHASGQWVSGYQAIKPVDDKPQSWGSAITYARRYGLAAIAGVAPEDDDGNEASGKPRVGTKEAQQEVAREKIAAGKTSVPWSAQVEALKGEMEAKKNEPPKDNVNPFTNKPYEERLISVPQQKRLFAIAKGAGWTDADMKLQLKAQWGYEHSKEISSKKYNEIVAFFEGGGKPPEPTEPPTMEEQPF